MNHISINQVVARGNKCVQETTRYYFPLYTSYKTKYNSNNILESLSKWDSYSSVQEDNIEKMLELFDIVSDNGTIKDIEKATSIVTENVLSLNDFSYVKKELESMRNTQPILASIREAMICDKLIENHASLSKRFNFDEYAKTHSTDKEDCVLEMCAFVDTYNIGIDSKYRMALDEIAYTFAKNGIKYPSRKILEDVSTYFLCLEMEEEDYNRELLDIMEMVLRKDPFFTDDDKQYITELKELRRLKPKQIIKKSQETFTSGKKTIASLVNRFKSLPKKDPEALKNLIRDLLTFRREEDIVDGTANALAVCFTVFITLGVLSISLVAGMLTFMVVTLIGIHLSWKTAQKVLTKFHKSRAKVAKKIAKEKNPEKKEKLKVYLKELDAQIDKLEDHYDSLKPNDSDSAMDKRPENYDPEDFEDDNMDFDVDIKFESAFYGTDVKSLIEAMEIVDAIRAVKWPEEYIGVLYNEETYKKVPLDTLLEMTQTITDYPGFADTLQVQNTIKDAIWSIRKDEPDYEKIVKLGLACDKMSSGCCVSEDTYTAKQAKEYLQEMDTRINNLALQLQSINELSVPSTIKLGIDKVINTVKAVDDKLEGTARGIDSISRFITQKIEKACSMENREAVIRGDILPSMSKCIKLVLATGVAALINPALAIVGLVVKFVMSSRMRTKERQLVLNELDVELQMVDKYIHEAEEKKDFKKLRELLLLKKKLQAQYSRLRYNIKVHWNDKDIDEMRGKTGEE